MKLPAFFGHKRSINLLPRDPFESSTLGIILDWALVFGKWAVIITQLIVMGSFLFRFTLDRTLTDLRKAIMKDVAIIKSYEQVERDYTLVQRQLATAKTIIESQAEIGKAITNIERITPSEIWLDRISVTPSTITINAYASSLPGFGRFLTAIQHSPQYNGVRVGKIETSTTGGAQLQFDVAMNLANQVVSGVQK